MEESAATLRELGLDPLMVDSTVKRQREMGSIGKQENVRETLKSGRAAMLDAISAGNDPFAARRGEFKKAYLSQVDNTLQPYQMFVPSSYDKAKSFPLMSAAARSSASKPPGGRGK